MPPGSPAPAVATAPLVVAGAHLRGEPLHADLLARGARFLRATRTAPVYRMVALPPAPAASPLAIGTVALAGGDQAPGFVCEGYARDGVEDISHFGGWRRYGAAQR